MKKVTKFAGAMTAATLLFSSAIAAENDKSGDIKVGVLTCELAGETNFIIGSEAVMNCTFDSAVEGLPNEAYTAEVSDFGLDIGTTESATMVWGVFAPVKNIEAGALEGTYSGVTAGATLGVGVKANAMVGGFDESITLNPVSVETQTGANLTLGVTQLKLSAV